MSETGIGSSIGERDWQDGPGCESANVGVDRRNPRYAYGGCYQGIFEELDVETGLTRSIWPWAAARWMPPYLIRTAMKSASITAFPTPTSAPTATA